MSLGKGRREREKSPSKMEELPSSEIENKREK